MRGRLINRMFATFGVLNQPAMVYDSDYLAPDDPSLPREETQVTFPAQIEEASWFRGVFKPQGLEQDGEISVILHYSDLETLGWLDPVTGAPLVTIGARLISISRESGAVVRSYPDPPGLYVVQARDSSWGLAIDANPTRNLLFLLLSPRPRSL